MHHVFVKIHKQLHVSAMLSQPQADYNYMRRTLASINVILL